MASTRINNQAVKLYTPLESLFNDGNDCYWHLDFFQLVTCDDITEIIIDSGVQEENIQINGDFDAPITGTSCNCSFTPPKLVDNTATFLTDVEVGMTVTNTVTLNTAKVTSVASDSILGLDSGIFSSFSPQGYKITSYDLVGNMTISGNEAVKTAGATGSFTQDAILTLNQPYQLSIDITSFSTTTPGDQINIYIGSNVVLTLDETDITTGTVTATAFATGAGATEIKVEADSGIAATFSNLSISKLTGLSYLVKDCETDAIVYTSVVGDVSMSPLSTQVKISFDWANLSDGYTCDNGCYYIEITDEGETGDYTFRTDCFQLSDSHDCTVKLSGGNLDDAFGIDFLGTSYTPFIRVQGQLETPKYGGKRENEEDSLGISKTVYFKSEKRRSLFLYQLPEHIHDFVRLLIGYDTFLIDDVDYVADNSEYEPQAERVLGKLPALSNASVEVRLKTDNNENKYC